MAFRWENYPFYFQLLEENDGPHCEQSDKLLATLEKSVNISAVIQLGVSFVFFLLHKRLEGNCMKGFFMQNCSGVNGIC